MEGNMAMERKTQTRDGREKNWREQAGAMITGSSRQLGVVEEMTIDVLAGCCGTRAKATRVRKVYEPHERWRLR